MLIVIAYDIADDGRRNAVSDWLTGWGDRVQLSVFECHLTEPEFGRVRQKINLLIEPSQDRVRYYRLCRLDQPRVFIVGTGIPTHDVAFRIY